VWSIEDLINQSDLVVGLGRSAYDAMACGRCVLVYDYRDYMGEFLGDGILMPESINKSMQCNCSGRSGRYKYDVQDFIKEMQKYTPELAAWSREFALENLNIEKVARSYLNMVKTEQGVKDDCTALKMRLKEILQTIQEEKSDLREEHNLCANRMFDVQKQLMEQQTRCYEKSRKHLRAIRLLLWLCIILVITIVFLMLNM
jgi:Fe2+ transport system protein B